MSYIIFKIREGKEAAWRAWCGFLIRHKAEVLDTMKQEALTRETCEKIGDYIIYSTEGEDLLAHDTELNRMHKAKKKECLQKVSAETLFDFKIE